MKLDPGQDGYLAQWPARCVCGAQQGPMVDTGIDSVGYGNRVADPGRIYLCRLCVTRAGRALGLVKGEEMTRLQDAADGLAQAAKEIEERQQMIKTLTESAGEREAKLNTQREYIESLQAELTQQKHFANTIAATAKEMVAA